MALPNVKCKLSIKQIYYNVSIEFLLFSQHTPFKWQSLQKDEVDHLMEEDTGCSKHKKNKEQQKSE